MARLRRHLFIFLVALATACGGSDGGDDGGGTGAGNGAGAGNQPTRDCTNACSAAGQGDCTSLGFRTCGDFDEDECLEWSEVTACGANTACVDGACVSGCTNDCVAGSVQCGRAGGVQRCVSDADADPCLDWGPETPCGAGESCSLGQCASQCANECGAIGDRQCSAGGVQTCGDFDADTCLEWGEEAPCDAGQSCSLGQCREATACVNECAADTRQCQGNGFQSCGNFDEDTCLEWSTVTPCEEGAVCSLGTCDAACVNECGTSGQRQCSGNGVEICGDHDDDDCLEWAEPTACPAGQTCSSGRCAIACGDECAEGGRQCSGAGFQACGDFDDDDCLEWSAVTPCDDGETCSGGECAVTCSNECGVVGAAQCGGNGVQSCDDHDDDPCLEWGTPAACPQGQSCSGGRCASTCSDECAEDSTRCTVNGVQTCGDFDEDACQEWGSATPCPEGQTCSSGACGVTCGNECVLGARRCAPGGFQTCGDTDDDDCTEWGPAQSCGEGTVCSGGECAARCTDECPAGGRRCDGNGVQSCGDFDEDDCQEWSERTACAAGEVCSNGACAVTCTNECVEGARQCSGNGVQTCGNHDDDACLEWGAAAACASGERCSGGACASFCADECAEGAARCGTGGVQRCGNFDDDACLEWGAGVACPAGQLCSNGACAATCSDECADGALRCAAGGGRQACGDFDDDDCRDWSAPAPCDQGEVCDQGGCVAFVEGCSSNADCAEGFACINARCRARRACAEAADCAAGETCDSLSGFCTQAASGLPEVGDECGMDNECGADLFCDFSFGAGICSGACDAETPCPSGSTCFTTEMGFSQCLRDCASSAGCEAGQACFAAAGPLGGACAPVECVVDDDCDASVVLTERCINGACETEQGCDLATGEGCADGTVCVNFDGNGLCLAECNVFDGCSGAGEACFPVGSDNAGYCVPAGATAVGAPCTDTFECVAGALCLNDAVGNGRCYATCNVIDEAACGEGSSCRSIGSDDLGACVGDCESECFLEDVRCAGGALTFCEQLDEDVCLEWGAPSACGAGQGCSEIDGTCIEACVDDSACDAGAVISSACVAGDCQVVSECDPVAATGCEEAESCFLADSSGTKGVCAETCDAIDGGCSDAADTCVPFSTVALCLEPGVVAPGGVCDLPTDCTAGGICVTLTNSTLCHEICDRDLGDAGCPAGTQCAETGIDGRVGFCAEACEDECVAGSQQCGAEGGVQTCGDFDDDICTEWSDATPCETGQSCDPEFNVCRIFCDEDSDCDTGVESAFRFFCDLDTNRCAIEECSVAAGTCGPMDADVCIAQDFASADDTGFCLTPCNPVDQNCPTADSACDAVATGESTTAFVCVDSGGVDVGFECGGVGDCVPGATCLGFIQEDESVVNVCVVLCDTTANFCSPGEVCSEVPFFEAPVGYCAPTE